MCVLALCSVCDGVSVLCFVFLPSGWCWKQLETEGGTEEDLGGEPLSWMESLGSGGPLFYSSLLRWQASALQVSIFVAGVCW